MLFSLANMEHMYEMNLFINDLSMHDVSRDLVMVGTDRSKELKAALKQLLPDRKAIFLLTHYICVCLNLLKFLYIDVFHFI